MVPPCGWIAEQGPGVLHRVHRIRSDLLVDDLQYRLRCWHCNRRSGFQIATVDGRSRGGWGAKQRERIGVPAIRSAGRAVPVLSTATASMPRS